MDFSTIVQSPQVRAIVQDGILERKFYDGLFPSLVFRSEAMKDDFPLNVGDSMTFTGRGLMDESTQPIQPGNDIPVGDYGFEQWDVTIAKYGRSIDTDMPTSVAAAAALFLSNTHTLGLNGGRTMNKLARNALFNAGLSGWTDCDGNNGGASTTIRVKRLNGFTKARNPNTSNASQVKYSVVSSTNPLAITMFLTGGTVTRNVIGFTPDNAGDEVGPGTLTIDSNATCTDRDAIMANDATAIFRVGGGNHVDDIGSNDIMKLSDARNAVARLRNMNVAVHDDQFYHVHCDPTTEVQIQSDSEWRTLFTAMPNDYRFQQFAIGRAAGAIWFRNVENPQSGTVKGGATAVYSTNDNFGGELWSNGATTGVPIHRAIFTGGGLLKEYKQAMEAQITEAGVTGKVGKFTINNNGITVNTDDIQLIIRAPIDRAQEKVASSWKWVGNFVARTDGATGDAARYKRCCVVEHGA